MGNLKAVLIPNSHFKTMDEFWEAQKEVKDPMVVIQNGESEVIEHFWIETVGFDDLDLQYKYKFFYTTSIEAGKHEKKYGATFIGVEPGCFEEEINECFV